MLADAAEQEASDSMIESGIRERQLMQVSRYQVLTLPGRMTNCRGIGRWESGDSVTGVVVGEMPGSIRSKMQDSTVWHTRPKLAMPIRVEIE